MTFRTQPPANYHPPSDFQIEEAGKSVELDDKFTTDLIKDVTNLAAGGTVVDQADWPEDQIAASLEASKKLIRDHAYDSDFLVHGNLPNCIYKKGRDEATLHRDLARANLTEHTNAQEFAQNLDLSKFPDGSPLNKTVQGLKVLAARDSGKAVDGEDKEGPFGSNPGDGKRAADDVHDALERAQEMDDTDSELLGIGGSGGGDGDPDGDLIAKAIQAMEVKEMLDVSRHMQGTTSLQIGTAPTFMEDPQGTERMTRPIRAMSEMHRLAPSEWGYPERYRTYRIVTGQARVTERYSREANKQFLYVIVDRSGSMDAPGRIEKAVGVLYDRLRAVVEGDAELYFAYFQDDLEKEHRVRTPEEATALLTMARGMPPAGGTDIAQSLRTCVSRIEKHLANDPKLVRPEIALVSDGDAYLPHVSDLGKCKLNVFNIDMANGPLCQLARSTGGVGVDRL